MLTKIDHLGMNNRIYPFRKPAPNCFRRKTKDEVRVERQNKNAMDIAEPICEKLYKTGGF